MARRVASLGGALDGRKYNQSRAKKMRFRAHEGGGAEAPQNHRCKNSWHLNACFPIFPPVLPTLPLTRSSPEIEAALAQLVKFLGFDRSALPRSSRETSNTFCARSGGKA
jgi:hypothetical protein